MWSPDTQTERYTRRLQLGAIYRVLTITKNYFHILFMCFLLYIFFLFAILYPMVFFAANYLTTKRLLSRTIYVFCTINLGFLFITCIFFILFSLFAPHVNKDMLSVFPLQRKNWYPTTLMVSPKESAIAEKYQWNSA